MASKEKILTTTRMYGPFPQERVPSTVEAIRTAKEFGPSLIVSDNTFAHLDSLSRSVAVDGSNLRVEVYNGRGDNHGGMLNIGVEATRDRGLPYFATVSTDLLQFAPALFTTMLARLEEDPALTTVGVAIRGIHDTRLLDQIKNNDASVIPSTYGELFVNNAFSIHRVDPISLGRALLPEDREFLQHDRSPGELLGRHEDIEIALRLLSKGYPLKILLLAGDMAIARDPQTEVASATDKNGTRQQAADFYQEYYGIKDEELQKYLDEFFSIEFVS